MQAQNSARRTVFDNSPEGRLIASELLDSNVCPRCRDIDGTEYDSMEAAIQDYPSGGYFGCHGGARCRGTLVKIFDTETPPSVG